MGAKVISLRERKRRRHRRPVKDPVELARLEADRRHNPGKWGLPTENLQLAQNKNVVIENASLQNIARGSRYNAFALLKAWKSIDQGHYDAAQRLTEMLAQRAATAGASMGAERIDGSKSVASGITDLRIRVGDEVEYVIERMGSASAVLILALIRPEIETGAVNRNWRETVEFMTGETDPKAQCGRVREACENLRGALTLLDKASWEEIHEGRRAKIA